MTRYTICPWCNRTVGIRHPRTGSDTWPAPLPRIRSHLLETAAVFSARCPLSGAERDPEKCW